MEKNGWDRNKAVLEYQKIHRAEIHRVEDEFYFGRDTLYLLWNAQDSLSFRDKRGRYVWWLFVPEKDLEDPKWLLTVMRKYRFIFERVWSFRQGSGISLTDKQLSSLYPANRKELADFFRRELNRESRKYDRGVALMGWGLWNLLDYFPKVYMLVPKGGDFYDKYECEF